MARKLVAERKDKRNNHIAFKDRTSAPAEAAVNFQNRITQTLVTNAAITAMVVAAGVGPADAIAKYLPAATVLLLINHSAHSLGLFGMAGVEIGGV